MTAAEYLGIGLASGVPHSMNLRIAWRALILLTIWPATAMSDWSVAGAQYRCDQATSTFEVLPYTQSSSGDSPIPPGFTVLPTGTSLLQCELGRRPLTAQIVVVDPQARGVCMGGGSAGIRSLSVNGVELQDKGITLNWDCPNDPDPPVVGVKVIDIGPSVTLTQCSDAPDGTHCATVAVDVDRIAADYARLDHDLADPETQSAQAASKLPAFNDLARVYASQMGSEGVPICAHWVDDFFSASILDGILRYGRVAGGEGERVPLYRRNPQLCSREDGVDCEAHHAFLPGDRLQVGLICGAWTYVRWQSRLRTVDGVRGWIATERLYGISPILEPVPASKAPWSNDPIFKHPLIEAIVAGDAARVRALVAAGEDPNGPQEYSGYPLQAALSRGDAEMAAALLDAGADPNRADRKGNVQKATALMLVSKINRPATARGAFTVGAGSVAANPVHLAKLLIGAGADVNQGDKDGATALLYALWQNNVDVVALLLISGADPHTTRTSDGVSALSVALQAYPATFDPSGIRLLLDHGADPNGPIRFSEDGEDAQDGETALSLAARKGYMTVVRALLEHGADPASARGDGTLPAEVARQNGHGEIADLIARYSP